MQCQTKPQAERSTRVAPDRAGGDCHSGGGAASHSPLTRRSFGSSDPPSEYTGSAAAPRWRPCRPTRTCPFVRKPDTTPSPPSYICNSISVRNPTWFETLLGSSSICAVSQAARTNRREDRRKSRHGDQWHRRATRCFSHVPSGPKSHRSTG